MEYLSTSEAGMFSNPAYSVYPKSATIAKSLDTYLVKPGNVQEVIDWAEFICRNYGGLVADTRKAVSYFLTDIRIEPLPGVDLTPDDLEKYQANVNTANIYSLIVEYGSHLCLFGTSLVTAQDKTTRILVCETCGNSQRLSAMISAGIVQLNTSDYKFTGQCLHKDCKAGTNAKFRVSDRYNKKEPPVFVFHDLRGIAISYNPFSGTRSCALNPQRLSSLKTSLSRQDRSALLDTPVELFEALASSQEIILDNPESFHLDTIRPPSYRAVDYGGWGLPLFYSSFQNVMMLVLLDAYNRKILTERILPTELISPAVANRGGTMGDMIQDVINPDDFSNRIKRVIGESRNGLLESQRVFAFPYPVTYQVIGGDAKNLVAVDLMRFYKEQILDDMGIPPEIRNTGGQGVAKGGYGGGLMFFAPSWAYISAKMNRFVNWVGNRIGRTLGLPAVNCYLEPPTQQQDPQKLQYMFERLQMNDIAPSTVARAMGFNFRNEIKMALQDNEWKARYTQKYQKKSEEKDVNNAAVPRQAPGATVMQQNAGGGAGGGMPAPGADPMAAGGGGAMPPPPGGGGGMPAQTGDPVTDFLAQVGFAPGTGKDPETIGNMAQQIAGAMVQIPDKGMRQRIFDRLRNTDQLVYGQVKLYVEKLGTAAESAGRQSLTMPAQ